MNVPRREVIKGLVLTGLSGALPSKLAAGLTIGGEHRGSASNASTILILVDGSSHDGAFLDGARAAAGRLGATPFIVRLDSSIMDDVARVEGLLRTRLPLIALVGPADGILLEELVRGNGLRIIYRGSHRLAGPDGAHRHHVTTTAVRAEAGLSLVTEGPPGRSAASDSRPWAAHLGGSLVEAACGDWRPATSSTHSFLSRGERGGEHPENLTSMLIQG